jgi:hypothetical protein
MYSTTAYLYQQKKQVVVLNSSGAYFDRRWQPVYAKNLKINRGVDNVILFEFINQDQKPVNISGSTITFRLISQDGSKQLIAKDLVHLNSTYGRAKVTLLSTELDTIDAQTASYSLERGSGDLYEPVFVDDYVGGRGTVEIQDSIYPDFKPSQDLTVAELLDPARKIDDKNRVHTSIAYIGEQNFTTFQFSFDNFTGNVKAQGSDTQLGPWYDIDNQTVYVNQTERAHVNINGRHNYVRFEINQYGKDATATSTVNNGAVSSVTVANGGDQFLGTNVQPNVEINGLGTGATATATVDANSVNSITLTGTGQGYMQAPNVKINLGSITSIVYR